MTPPGAHDPVGHAHVLHDVFESVMSGDEPRVAPRSLISASWERSLAAHVDPDRRMPRAVYSDDEMTDLRNGHPLNEVMPLLRSTLVSIADEAMHVMLVTDADGTILWREGATRLLHAADATGLSPGFSVSEASIGTNAMGTTLAVDAPVQIHSAEHLVRAYHIWTCAAAPVHDPDTGLILGAIDISGPIHTMHPAMAQLVSATAQLAENQLRVRLAIADERLRVRNMPHLTSLRGREGALVTSSGRIIASEPYGIWPERVAVPEGGGRVTLDDGREMEVEPLAEGYLLHAPRRAASTPATAARCRCGSPATPRRGPRWTVGRCRSRCARPSCSPRSPCTPTASPPSSSRPRSTATTATPPPCAARCCGCAGSSAPTCCAPVPTGWTRWSTPISARPAGPCARAGRRGAARVRGAAAAPLGRPGDPRAARRAGRGPAPRRARQRRRRAARRVRRAPPRRGRPGDPRPAGRGAAPARPPPPRLRRPARPAADRVAPSPARPDGSQTGTAAALTGSARRPGYSTVTLLARLRGLSTSRPSTTAAW